MSNQKNMYIGTIMEMTVYTDRADRCNRVVEIMEHWGTSNGIQLNASKSFALHFAIKNITLDYSFQVKTEERTIENVSRNDESPFT